MTLPKLLRASLLPVVMSCLGTVGFASLGLEVELVSERRATATDFPLVDQRKAAGIFVSSEDLPGVKRAAADLRDDVERVTGVRPELAVGSALSGAPRVLVGTLGHSPEIDALVSSGKLEVSAIRGRWEAFTIATVHDALPGIDQALVIAGSDQRGTIYGLYELSEQLGVSPWYWWADVPVRQRASAFVLGGAHSSPGPVVRYRGIFLNDEAPALTGWAREKFGGLNSAFYAKVFELLLRLRANYLWPAMWDNAFYQDDPRNGPLAAEYGIVMGTSHHEPMLRAHKEWRQGGKGPWDYAHNAETLSRFWSEGVRRSKGWESIVTIGMRGNGDEPMSEEANIALLQRIVADQRELLRTELGTDPASVPQIWALYKEVQEYYERGMRVPDDVTLLWCDDNWGNIRRLPTEAERSRPGGAGVYYHFDYVGGPRNYKWLNTVPLTKVQEQMHLAWKYEATRLWIVNVGDLKPMEVPIEFFLRYAWDPARWPYERLGEYLTAWSAREFGAEHASEIAALISGYTRLNGLRKPELLSPDTYSLLHEQESERIAAQWSDLRARALALRSKLPDSAQAAFLQLVLHPLEASAVVNDLHRTAALNRLHASQGRASTNASAETARRLFREDAALTARWDAMLDGKWLHMMDQVHLGYTGWQQPPANVMPAVSEVQARPRGDLALAVEGDADARPGDYPIPGSARLPTLHASAGTTSWFEVFNRGSEPVRFKVQAREPWLLCSIDQGVAKADQDVRVEVRARWDAVPEGTTTGRIEVIETTATGTGRKLRIDVPVRKLSAAESQSASGAAIEVGGVVAVEAPDFSRSIVGEGVSWRTLPAHGRWAGGVTAEPVTAPSLETLGAASPRLEYDLWTESEGQATLHLFAAPTQAFIPGRGLRFAVAINGDAPVIVDLIADRSEKAWDTMVANSVNHVSLPLKVSGKGRHLLRVFYVDPGVVLERWVLAFGPLKPTYLGPRPSPKGILVPN